MARYVIKYTPTDKVVFDGEGGRFLIDENHEEGVISWGNKKDVDNIFEDLKEEAKENGYIYTEMGNYPIMDFEISIIK